MKKDVVTVATDGSCLTNPGFAGWAWVVSGDTIWQSGAIAHGTNQVAELSALMNALTGIPADVPLLIQADSQYAIKCASVWLPSWKRNGWKTASGGEVKNQQLIRAIDAALMERKDAGGRVKFEWVRGHNGHALNEQADVLCGLAAREAKAGAIDGTVYGPGWEWDSGESGISTPPRNGVNVQPSPPVANDLRLFDNW